jgi:TRAP-type mannitol/chloroaromatic compound transport system permease small subunit
VPLWLRAASAIDGVSAWIGGATAWLTLVMVLVGAYNAIARYVERGLGIALSSNAYIELQWYLFSAVFLLGGAAALRDDAHVRVDVLYARLSARARAWIDVAGTALLLLPFALFVLWTTWPWLRASWKIRETSPDPGGLWRYPVKTLVAVGFVLLVLQALAVLARRVATLLGVDAPDRSSRAAGPAAEPGADA